MKKKTTTALTVLGVAAAGVAGYEIYKHTRPAAQRAGVGDTVVVDGSKLPPGSLPMAIPAGAASQFALQIGSQPTGDSVAGTVMGYVVNGQVAQLPIAAPIFLGSIPRTAIVGIVTNGAIAA
jgi:hypothetical protein